MPPKAKAAKKEKAPKEKKPKAEGENMKGKKKLRSESNKIHIQKVLKHGLPHIPACNRCDILRKIGGKGEEKVV